MQSAQNISDSKNSKSSTNRIDYKNQSYRFVYQCTCGKVISQDHKCQKYWYCTNTGCSGVKKKEQICTFCAQMTSKQGHKCPKRKKNSVQKIHQYHPNLLGFRRKQFIEKFEKVLTPNMVQYKPQMLLSVFYKIWAVKKAPFLQQSFSRYCSTYTKKMSGNTVQIKLNQLMQMTCSDLTLQNIANLKAAIIYQHFKGASEKKCRISFRQIQNFPFIGFDRYGVDPIEIFNALGTIYRPCYYINRHVLADLKQPQNLKELSKICQKKKGNIYLGQNQLYKYIHQDFQKVSSNFPQTQPYVDVDIEKMENILKIFSPMKWVESEISQVQFSFSQRQLNQWVRIYTDLTQQFHQQLSRKVQRNKIIKKHMINLPDQSFVKYINLPDIKSQTRIFKALDKIRQIQNQYLSSQLSSSIQQIHQNTVFVQLENFLAYWQYKFWNRYSEYIKKKFGQYQCIFKYLYGRKKEAYNHMMDHLKKTHNYFRDHNNFMQDLIQNLFYQNICSDGFWSQMRQNAKKHFKKQVLTKGQCQNYCHLFAQKQLSLQIQQLCLNAYFIFIYSSLCKKVIKAQKMVPLFEKQCLQYKNYEIFFNFERQNGKIFKLIQAIQKEKQKRQQQLMFIKANVQLKEIDEIQVECKDKIVMTSVAFQQAMKFILHVNIGHIAQFYTTKYLNNFMKIIPLRKTFETMDRETQYETNMIKNILILLASKIFCKERYFIYNDIYFSFKFRVVDLQFQTKKPEISNDLNFISQAFFNLHYGKAKTLCQYSYNAKFWEKQGQSYSWYPFNTIQDDLDLSYSLNKIPRWNITGNRAGLVEDVYIEQKYKVMLQANVKEPQIILDIGDEDVDGEDINDNVEVVSDINHIQKPQMIDESKKLLFILRPKLKQKQKIIVPSKRILQTSTVQFIRNSDVKIPQNKKKEVKDRFDNLQKVMEQQKINPTPKKKRKLQKEELQKIASDPLYVDFTVNLTEQLQPQINQARGIIAFDGKMRCYCQSSFAFDKIKQIYLCTNNQCPEFNRRLMQASNQYTILSFMSTKGKIGHCFNQPFYLGKSLNNVQSIIKKKFPNSKISNQIVYKGDFFTKYIGSIIKTNKRCEIHNNYELLINKVMQNQSRLPVQIKMTDHKGYGVFATKLIHPNTLLTCYTGEAYIDYELPKQFNDSNVDIGWLDHNYVVMSPKQYVNLGRFFNGVCEGQQPNLKSQWAIINGKLHLLMITTKQILPNQQICWNYGLFYSLDEHQQKQSKKMFNQIHETSLQLSLKNIKLEIQRNFKGAYLSLFTGDNLFFTNCQLQERRSCASVIKLLNCLLCVRMCQYYGIDMDQYNVVEGIADVRLSAFTNVGLKNGQYWTINGLLRATLIVSGCDSARFLAILMGRYLSKKQNQNIYISLAYYLAKMQELAQFLGIRANINDERGINSSHLSARQVQILTKYCFDQSSIWQFAFNKGKTSTVQIIDYNKVFKFYNLNPTFPHQTVIGKSGTSTLMQVSYAGIYPLQQGNFHFFWHKQKAVRGEYTNDIRKLANILKKYKQYFEQVEFTCNRVNIQDFNQAFERNNLKLVQSKLKSVIPRKNMVQEIFNQWKFSDKEVAEFLSENEKGIQEMRPSYKLI